MQSTKTYQVNFDFEQQLYNPQWKHQKQRWNSLNMEFEYLYLYTENDSLHACAKYSQKYLNKLFQLGINPKINSIEKNSNLIPWWGQLTNIELEKRLNDKFEALKCAEYLKLPHFSSLVSTSEQLLALSENYDDLCFMRTRYGQAGKNLKLFTNGQALQSYSQTTPFLNGPFNQGLKNTEGILCGMWKKRQLDIGARYWIAKDSLPQHWFSFVDHFGIYRGGLYINNKKIFAQLCQKFTINYDLLCADQQRVLAYYIEKLGLQDSIQLDSFLSMEKLIPFQEANHRRTMGDVLLKLDEKFGNSKLSMLIFEKRTTHSAAILCNRRDFEYSIKTREGILHLTPQENGYLFDVFFISFSKNEQIAKIKSAFPDFFEQQLNALKLLELALS